MGFVLEQLYGLSFETLVRQHIAEPLGMRGTMNVPSSEQRSRLSPGHDGTGRTCWPGPEEFEAAGGLSSTLADLLAYARWQLDERAPTVQLTHQPTYRQDEYAVGLNWQMLRKGSRRVLWQDGAIPGYARLLTLHPQSGLALVTLTNGLNGATLQSLRGLTNSITAALDRQSLSVP